MQGAAAEANQALTTEIRNGHEGITCKELTRSSDARTIVEPIAAVNPVSGPARLRADAAPS